MNKEKMNKYIIAIVLAIFVIVSVVVLLSNTNRIENVSLEKYEPFTAGNLLENYSCVNKIVDNLPKVEGASAFYPLSANIVQALFAKANYTDDTLSMVSTSKAYEDLASGTADIIIATLPSKEQSEIFKNNNIEIEYVFLYKEPLVMYVNKKNKTNNINIDEIIKAYTTNTKYNTYNLEKGNGSQNCFESLVKENTIDNKHKVVTTMEDIIDSVGKDRNGLGYAFATYYNKMHINKNTKAINVENISPDNYDYPLQFEVYLMYRKDNTNENINHIVDYLKSEEGRELLNTVRISNNQVK